MRIWDIVFPNDQGIVVWGAGVNGKRWVKFLETANKRIEFIVDKELSINSFRVSEAEDDIVYPVKHPDEVVFSNELVLITPVEHAEEIYSDIIRRGGKNILIGNMLNHLPFDYDLTISDLLWVYQGHFYSLYPSIKEVKENYCNEKNKEISGINNDGVDLCVERQKEYLAQMNALFETIPKWKNKNDVSGGNYRYRIGNSAFGLSDAIVLHTMLRLLKPKRLIEVGSGYSSAVTLDTNEYYLNNEIQISFIEPYPKLLYSIMKNGDKESVKIYHNRLQEMPLSVFMDLNDGDVLFIDSTHVSKFGSDVNYLFFHILPSLKPGVIVHLHDIFYPWEYPEQWLINRAWNELYLLRAFLQNNNQWEVLFFNHFMAMENKEDYCENWKKIEDLGGGSFWMRKNGIREV